MSPAKTRRQQTEEEQVLEENKPLPVSAGPMDKVVEFTFNPSREKIREVTWVDRYQARMLPLLDTINAVMAYCVEVATYRMDKEQYKKTYHKERPVQPDIVGEFIYRLAQWQKSIGAKNLDRALDIALAEKEAEAGGDSGGGFGGSGMDED